MNRRDRARLKSRAEELNRDITAFRRRLSWEFLYSVVIMVLVTLALRAFVVAPVHVEGGSMEPTLYEDERMLVDKLSYCIVSPAYGDIVICRYPGHDYSCVKRIIGLPGDTVAVTNGVLYVNGAAVEEPYIKEGMWLDFSETVVPAGHVFVMGDNRNHSSDSRSILVGPIPLEQVSGRAIAVVWPLSALRGL